MAPEIDGVTRSVSPPPEHTQNTLRLFREPLGVATNHPFNFPLILAGTKIAAAPCCRDRDS